MIHFWNANRIPTQAKRISRNRKSHSARQTSRSKAACNGHSTVTFRTKARNGSGATNGERANGLQLAQTLARQWDRRTSQQSASWKKAQSYRRVLFETRRSAE